MKFLIDTNIILDVILKREPFYNISAKVLSLSKYDNIILYVSASAITDIYYISSQTLRNKNEAKNILSNLIKIVSIASVSENEIRNALSLLWKDFEDSVQYSVALLQEMDGIITRNKNDYKDAEIEILGPEEILSRLQVNKDF